MSQAALVKKAAQLSGESTEEAGLFFTNSFFVCLVFCAMSPLEIGQIFSKICILP